MGVTHLIITRETDYALRILRALSNGEQITTTEICQREMLPQQFAYKILKKLSKAGFVLISRGTDGGCRLISDLHKLNLYDLVAIIDTNTYITACMNPDFQCASQQKSHLNCIAHKRLQKIQGVLDTELRSHSLHEMLFGDD